MREGRRPSRRSRADDVQVGLLFSTDPSIEANGFVPLVDDKHLQDAENITPVIRTDKLNDEVRTLLDARERPALHRERDRARREGRDGRAGCRRRGQGVPGRERPPVTAHVRIFMVRLTAIRSWGDHQGTVTRTRWTTLLPIHP